MTYYRDECRGLKLWPVVLADLIAEYADYTIEDRIDLLCSEYREGADIYTDRLKAHCRMWCWWTTGGVVGGRPHMLSFSFSFNGIHTSTSLIPKEMLGSMIRDRVWRNEQGNQREMSSGELAMLNKWLDSAILEPLWTL